MSNVYVQPDPFASQVRLDEPFEVDSDMDPVIELLDEDLVRHPPSLPPVATAVTTPCGDEIVRFSELEEKTVVMDAAVIASLQEQTCLHRHGTVPSMPAVKVD